MDAGKKKEVGKKGGKVAAQGDGVVLGGGSEGASKRGLPEAAEQGLQQEIVVEGLHLQLEAEVPLNAAAVELHVHKQG